MDLLDDKLKQWNNHVILYSKGWYIWRSSPLVDLNQIAKRVGLEGNDEQVIGWLAELAFQAILELGDDTSWMDEFRNLFTFMFRNRLEIVERHAPHLLDEDFIVQRKYDTMMIDNLVKGLLVTLAKVYPDDEEDMPEPNASILSLQSPKERKKS